MLRWIAQFAMVMGLVVGGSFIPVEKKALQGVFEPGMIKVADDRIYIVEGANILVFSLQNLSLIQQFGTNRRSSCSFRELRSHPRQWPVS